MDPTEVNSVWVGAYVAVPDVNEIKDKIAKAKPTDKDDAEDSEWGLNRFHAMEELVQFGRVLQA